MDEFLNANRLLKRFRSRFVIHICVCDNSHTRLRRLRMHIISIIDLPNGMPKLCMVCVGRSFIKNSGDLKIVNLFLWQS